MQFSDLPNLGHNLRLFTYDPPGSAFGPPTAAQCPGMWIYNSGHFDISLGVPCSQPDPQGFCDLDSLRNYSVGRGEFGVVLVSRDDLTTLCNYRAPVQTNVPGPVQQVVTLPGGTRPISGGIGISSVSVSGGVGSTVVSGVIPSPGSPIEAGGLPGGVGTSGAAVNPPLNAIYRFILYDPTSDPNNPYATGASYPGCSAVNTVNCLPQSFPTQDAAVQYALARGEVPYKVLSADEPWGLINGTIGIDPNRILSGGSGLSLETIGLIGLGLWFLSGR